MLRAPGDLRRRTSYCGAKDASGETPLASTACINGLQRTHQRPLLLANPDTYCQMPNFQTFTERMMLMYCRTKAFLKMLFVQAGDLELVPYFGPGAINCVRRKLENARSFQRDRRDSERSHVLFHVNDLLFLAEKDQIDREKHSNRMDAAGRHDPETAPWLGPSLGSPQKTNQPRKIAIGDCGLRGHKRLLCLVVDVHGMVVVTVARHTSPN